MRASEVQRIKDRLDIKIPKKKSYENPDLYDHKVQRLREIQAMEQIEAEPDPRRRRRMWYLFDNGIMDFSNV